MFERILCPVDFSEGSIKALQWTEYLARKFRSRVGILHVIDDYPGSLTDLYDEYRASVADRLQDFLSPLKIKYESTLSTGDPSKKIVALAEGLGSTLIVMGTRGLKGAAHKILGSVAENVLRGSATPVMTISPHCRPPELKASPRALVPLSTLQWPPLGYFRLKKILRELQADLTLVHVVDLRDNMFDSNFSANPFQVTTIEVTERRQRLLRLGDRLIHHKDTTDGVIRFGDAGQEIAKEVQSGNYDYVLIGARRKTLFYRFFESNVYKVISQSEVPAITFRVS